MLGLISPYSLWQNRSAMEDADPWPALTYDDAELVFGVVAAVGTDRLIRKVVVRPASNSKGRPGSETGQPCEEVASKAKVSVVVPVFVRTWV